MTVVKKMWVNVSDISISWPTFMPDKRSFYRTLATQLN